MIDVTDPAAVDLFLTEARDQFLSANSFIIRCAPYTFSTVSTLIKTMSSYDILFINTA